MKSSTEEPPGASPGKTLLVVNTGSIKKKPALQKLKKMGLRLVMLNIEKNWAQPYVDEWILADTFNHAESLEAVRTYCAQKGRMPFDGAVTFWEEDVPLLSKICAEYKLIGNSNDTATLTRDKYKMQECLARCGLPHIRQKLIKSKSDLLSAIQTISFPAVLKPIYGSDSEFVVRVEDEEEALETYKYLLKRCVPAFNPVFAFNKRTFLFQEYVEGTEFSIECYVQHGIPRVAGILEKTAMHMPFFMETGDHCPPRVDEEDVQKLEEAAMQALIVLGVKNSIAHVEAKMTKNNVRIIEVASRMGGDYIHEYIERVYGFDLVKSAAQIALGTNVTDVPKDPRVHMYGRYFIPEVSGVVTKIRGVEEARKRKNVHNITLVKKVGDSVFVPPDGFQNIGWISVQGKSVAETERTLAEASKMIDIDVSPFRTYSSVGKTQRRNRLSAALLGNIKHSISKIEKIRTMPIEELRNLHIGIACNIYESANGNLVEQDLMSVGNGIEAALKERGYRVSFFDFNDVPSVMEKLPAADVDLIFNVCERINDSSLLEPHAASVLDILQIPYTGSNPFTLSLCIDKIRVKKLLAFHGIPTPKWDYAYSMEDAISEDLRYPLIVKPSNTDNSIGVTNDSVVTNKKGLQKQLDYVINSLKSPALVEEYIEGDEYDVSILGSEEDDIQVLPLARSIFTNMPEGYWHIYPFEAKFGESTVYDSIIRQKPPKNISKKLSALITEIALDTYSILDCHDYGRVEIRTDKEGNPYVLELNPNPSIAQGDTVPACAGLVGMDYGDFLEEIMRLAMKRYKDKPQYSYLQASFL